MSKEIMFRTIGTQRSIMKLLLVIILLSIGCTPEKLGKCVNDKAQCKVTEPENSPTPPSLPIPSDPPPIVEPIIEEDTKPYYYNHSLYLKAFTFWGLNFVSDERINGNKQNTFTSTNTIQTTVGTQFKTVYAKIFFKDGESLKIHYYNNSSHALELSYERDWVIYDDMEFHIDGYKQGEFAWHSKIYPTLKTQNEIDDGIEMYLRTETVSLGVKCSINILLQETCTEKFLSTDIYTHYFFD